MSLYYLSFNSVLSMLSASYQNRPETHFAPQLIGLKRIMCWKQTSHSALPFEVDKRTLGGKEQNGSMCSIKYKRAKEMMKDTIPSLWNPPPPWCEVAWAQTRKHFSLYFQSCAELKPFWVSHLIDVTDPLVMKQWEHHYVCNSCAASHKRFPIDLQRARSLLSNLQGLRMIVVCAEHYSLI